MKEKQERKQWLKYANKEFKKILPHDNFFIRSFPWVKQVFKSLKKTPPIHGLHIQTHNRIKIRSQYKFYNTRARQMISMRAVKNLMNIQKNYIKGMGRPYKNNNFKM